MRHCNWLRRPSSSSPSCPPSPVPGKPSAHRVLCTARDGGLCRAERCGGSESLSLPKAFAKTPQYAAVAAVGISRIGERPSTIQKTPIANRSARGITQRLNKLCSTAHANHIDAPHPRNKPPHPHRHANESHDHDLPQRRLALARDDAVHDGQRERAPGSTRHKRRTAPRRRDGAPNERKRDAR